MAIKKIEIRPPSGGDYSDILYPKTSSDMVVHGEGTLSGYINGLEYQTPTISGTQIRLTKDPNANRLFFKLDNALTGNITISTDGGATSKNLVDVDGVQVTSLDKGFSEVVAYANFFTLRNRGLSPSDLQSLIAIANEMEANESVIKNNYINAIQGADGSITLPSDASWNDILLQIPNINKNKKNWVSGSTTSRWNGTNDKITVTNLNFKPSLVIAQNISGNWYNTVIAFRNSGLPFLLHYNNNGTETELGVIKLEDGTSSDETLYLSNTTNNVQFNDNGFVIPALNSNSDYSWIAIE